MTNLVDEILCFVEKLFLVFVGHFNIVNVHFCACWLRC